MTHLLNIGFPVLPQIHQTVKDRKELYLVLGTCEDAVSETSWRSLVKTFIVKKRRCINFHTICTIWSFFIIIIIHALLHKVVFLHKDEEIILIL